MERGLKERLVGAAVLVALGVIFIPMLLDDSPSGPGPITETNIPDRPDEADGFSSRIIPVRPEPVEMELPEPPADSGTPDPTADTAAAESEPAPKPPQTAEAPPTQADTPATAEAPADNTAAKSSEPATPKPSGWVIQLGSFTQEENARDLNAKLREAGHPSFVEPATQDGNKVYRVRVGPEVMRGEAEKLRDRIAADFDIKGIVISYP